jgi:hypothetical protein
LGVSIFVLAIGAGPALAQTAADPQSAGNAGGSQASNSSSTFQRGGQSQSGAGAQYVSQDSDTVQNVSSQATATQNAVNANLPVTVDSGGVSVGGISVGSPGGGGSSSATQNMSNSANSSASNQATTSQSASQSQDGDGSQSIEQDSDMHRTPTRRRPQIRTPLMPTCRCRLLAGRSRAR